MSRDAWIFVFRLFILVAFTSSCTTQRLWDQTNPNERVWISTTEVSEQQLIDKDIPYYKTEDILGAGYLIPKSKARQLGDVTLRMLATPVTITIDAATIVVVVGAIVITTPGFYYTYP